MGSLRQRTRSRPTPQLGDASLDDTVAAAREAGAEGLDCLKLEVGSRSLAEDLDRVGALRDAVDAAVLKSMALGGPGLTIVAARTRLDHGVDPVVMTTIDGAVARSAAVHVAAAILEVRPVGSRRGSFFARISSRTRCRSRVVGSRSPMGRGTSGGAFDVSLRG
ncbi:MAG: hypothetical protein V5A56_01875 [Halolamina sp.]